MSKVRDLSQKQGPIITLAHNLRYFRRESGLSQSDVAKQTGVSFRLIQELEAGRGNPTMETLCALAKCFKIASTRLVNLNFIRLATPEENFFRKFRGTFESVDLPINLRNLSGFSLWTNSACQNLLGRADSTNDTHCRLRTITKESYSVLMTELQSELRGYVSPYTITYESRVESKPIHIRCHPTLIYPKFGYTPIFTAVYMSEINEDSELSYYVYANHLLSCMQISEEKEASGAFQTVGLTV